MRCKRPWFYLGILSGFVTGFLTFAYTVYLDGNTIYSGRNSIITVSWVFPHIQPNWQLTLMSAK